jgi:quercetin dioxygenase-like cupin family protein
MEHGIDHRRTSTLGIAMTIVLVVVLIAGIGATASTGTETDPPPAPPPIQLEPLGPRATFTDDVAMTLRLKHEGRRTQVITSRDPSQIVPAAITVQPGAQFPWHTHHGPVIVVVTEGELTYVEADDCLERVYPAGTAFVDPGRGNVHTAFNATGDVTRLVATFYEVPGDAPLTITEGVTPGDCDIPVGSHQH